MTIRNGAAALAAVCWVCAAAAQSGAPPPTPQRPVTDRYFGTALTDPYRYLEDTQDPDVLAWMRAQADHARTQLDRNPGRTALLARVAELENSVPAQIRNVQRRPGELYFYEKRGADDDQYKLYLRRGLKGSEQLLVDPEALRRSTGQPQAINYFEASRSGRYLAYGISAAGSEEADLYVIDTAGGRRLLGPVSRAEFDSLSWLPDDSGFFFNRLQALPPGADPAGKYHKSRAYLLRLGGDPEQARPVLAFDTPGVSIDPVLEFPLVIVSPNGTTALGVVRQGTDNEFSLYAQPLAELLAGRGTWRKVFGRDAQVTDFATVGDRLFVLTHKGAPRFRVLETSLARPDLARARVVMPEGQGVLTEMVRSADALYLRRRDGSVSTLWRIGFSPGAQPVQLTLPVAGSFEFSGVDHRLPGALLSLQGWTRAPQIYAVAGRSITPTGLQPTGPFDAPADLITTEVVVPSHDGAPVPLSIVHRKDVKLDGSNPTLLFGYGAYGITSEPWFARWRLAWLERGGVFAVANPRGSGAWGQDWYQGGFKATKPNTWRDFIACAEYLIAQGYTRPARLGIAGSSAGGITAGRALTERPDLFAAVLLDVGALDTVRAELQPNGAPNIPEFGSHQTEEGFRALLAMSTYDHIRAGTAYPAVLLTHGVNDPRVSVWESLKTAARLQAASSSGRPVLLLLDFEAGHGVGETKAQTIADRSDLMTFFFWQFGVPEFQPAP